ncbi:bacteriophage abortive infection AbiH family protein [Clostridium cadaveris]|uniref:bacteriophage abortive infection AbiH family protein n=1 Tax=Clostridium cadaveris TaxID=1529 RepID=UPI000C07DFED|nr:bacteriophage abortive infection AbiH family protein [Clostridium cadaveris]
MKLFIIGNGFDLAHGLKTSYGDFRDYLEEEDWSYLESLEDMYGFCIDSKREWVKEYLWRDFEMNLSDIDETRIIEVGENIDLGLEGGDISCEDTLNEYWDEQYKFIERLNEFVKNWIKQLDISTMRKTDRINEDTNGLFITFNYTLLLEEVYGVEDYDILHIHGSINNNDSAPVIGHGNKEKIIEMNEISKDAGEKFEEKKCSIYGAVANYYERTLKDVQDFIRWNRSFFSRLNSVDEIFIIGHSLGDVDMPYFDEIKNNVSDNTIWNIYYYNDDDEILYREKIISMGVNERNIRVLKTDEFFNL